jgi:hypothetical protein
MTMNPDYTQTPGYKKAVTERQKKLAAEAKSRKAGKEEQLLTEDNTVRIEVQDASGMWRTLFTGVPKSDCFRARRSLFPHP